MNNCTLCHTKLSWIKYLSILTRRKHALRKLSNEVAHISKMRERHNLQFFKLSSVSFLSFGLETRGDRRRVTQLCNIFCSQEVAFARSRLLRGGSDEVDLAMFHLLITDLSAGECSHCSRTPRTPGQIWCSPVFARSQSPTLDCNTRERKIVVYVYLQGYFFIQNNFYFFFYFILFFFLLK